VTLDTIAKVSVAVDYATSLQDRIAAGRYDWVDDDITPKRFPIAGTGVVQFETKVFHFDRGISSKSAVEAIRADGWEPAQIEHLLSYGATYPDEQRQYPIIALGSVAEVYGDRNVPYLDRGGAERDLGLMWWVSDWDDDGRFLAVRKLSSAA
jgi:hypothetical protein